MLAIDSSSKALQHRQGRLCLGRRSRQVLLGLSSSWLKPGPTESDSKEAIASGSTEEFVESVWADNGTTPKISIPNATNKQLDLGEQFMQKSQSIVPGCVQTLRWQASDSAIVVPKMSDSLALRFLKRMTWFVALEAALVVLRNSRFGQALHIATSNRPRAEEIANDSSTEWAVKLGGRQHVQT